MQGIDRDLLDELSARAQASPRLRMNLNLHDSAMDPCQRMLNAIEPGSYVRPHRHLALPKFELFVAVRGRLAVILFSDDGSVARVEVLAPASSICAVEIPSGAWHTVIALDPGTVCFEIKPGPFQPIPEGDWAPWAPADGDPAEEYLRWLTAQIGQEAGEA